MSGIKKIKQLFFKLFRRTEYQKIIKRRKLDIEKTYKGLINFNIKALNTSATSCEQISYDAVNGYSILELKIFKLDDIFNIKPEVILYVTIKENTLIGYKTKDLYYGK